MGYGSINGASSTAVISGTAIGVSGIFGNVGSSIAIGFGVIVIGTLGFRIIRYFYKSKTYKN
jgi:hypothetical protein